ncbi:histidine--tRNA ligase [Anthocerotibacter panamensis]|uniref:histidine--tRNA ligase n=1 Tax=Anthocerotibacter panamensis TaxID=2857077 RepID=UPI001C404846|nr:histidine--tRNA ligase [Anthocerotibacter panamensis]
MAELNTPSGMRDFLPEVMQRREYALDIIKSVFRQWGFTPLETPAMERWETLSGKYGEEGEKLIYHCFNSGNLPDQAGQSLQFSRRERPELALRYDLTVPLARVMAMYGHTIAKPFKRYQIQPVWRGDRPGAGRFREFVQCDVDVIGSKSLLVEAELIALNHEVLTRLGFQDFTIRINHRLVLLGFLEELGLEPGQAGTVLIGIDKLDKLPSEKVQRELEAKGIPSEKAKKILAMVSFSRQNPYQNVFAEQNLSSPQAKEGIEQLTRLQDLLRCSFHLPKEHLEIDFSLARGLDYYTGTIFETVTAAQVGSIGGGGRYDKLIETLSDGKVDLPAAGTSLGLDRLLAAMEHLNLFAQRPSQKKILVTYFTDQELAQASLQLVSQLRAADLKAEIYYGESNFSSNALRKQLGYANAKGITHVLVLGPDELQRGKVTLKALAERTQETLPLHEVVTHLVERP